MTDPIVAGVGSASRVPEVSICLTTHQRAHLVGRTIESILAQTFTDFELLIQDNASEDGTKEICLAYQANDQRISYQRNAVNVGMPGNLNLAIARARGKYIANLHDGDHFSPLLIEKWRAALEETGAAFAFNALEVVDFDGRRIRTHHHPFARTIPAGMLTRYMLERFDSPVWGTVMARAECYRTGGLFSPRYSFIADVEMWMRLNVEHAVAYIPEPLISITPHEKDRPYAYVNWSLEAAAVEMRLATAGLLFGNSREEEAYTARLGRLAARRWSRFLLSCAVKGRLDLVDEGAALMKHSPWWTVRLAGAAAEPLMRALARLGRS